MIGRHSKSRTAQWRIR